MRSIAIGRKAGLMLTGLLAGLLVMTPVAASEPLTITGGSKGLTYDRWANNLAALMKGQGYKPDVQRSKGAVQNLSRVKAGEADVGYVQGDTLMAEGAEGVEILGTLGKECAYLVGLKDGKVTDEDDLQSDNGQTIAVGKRGTGSQTTWAYMGALEDGYKKTAADYVSGTRALGKLLSGQVDAMLFVTAPGNLEHKLIAAVNSNDTLQFLDVDDGDLNDKLPSGQAVYSFEEIEVKDALFGGTVNTICTPVLAVAKVDADDAVLDDLSSVFVGNLAAVIR